MSVDHFVLFLLLPHVEDVQNGGKRQIAIFERVRDRKIETTDARDRRERQPEPNWLGKGATLARSIFAQIFTRGGK